MSEQEKNYTITDVARELGVSKTTVSRALSGKGRIGKETRDRVFQFIETHNYHLKRQKQILIQKKSHNLSLVLPSISEMTKIPFF